MHINECEQLNVNTVVIRLHWLKLCVKVKHTLNSDYIKKQKYTMGIFIYSIYVFSVY